jgi:hypothetical protein
MVLQELHHHRLSLKLEKCQFETQETEYLGVMVGNGQVHMDAVKVQGVTNWPTPTMHSDIQSFLSFCNSYRNFVCGFTGIAQPLTKLMGLAPFEWTSHHKDLFDALQPALMTAPVLALLTNEDPYQLEADALAYAVGTTLLQRQDGIWRPIAFMSKVLSLTQHNYEIYDRELLAIMIALEDFRQYLINTVSPFKIWMDHANLQYFKKPQKLNRWQAHWLTKL